MTLGLPPGDLARLRDIAARAGETERRTRRREIGYDAQADAEDFYGLPLSVSDRPGESWAVDAGDLSTLLKSVQAARRRADLVLVGIHYHHWRPDWAGPPAWLVEAAEKISGAGADCVFGTGPPVAFPAQDLGRTAVALGLGNLVFHTRRGPRYDRLGLDVWRGQALEYRDNLWTSHDIVVPRAMGD